MLVVEVARESQAEFRTGSGTVGTDVARLGCGDAQQTVTVVASDGTFTLAVGGVATAAITLNAAAADVQTALEAVVGSGNVAVSGSAGGPWTVTFKNAQGGQPQPAMVGDASKLTADNAQPTVTVAIVAPGHDVGGEVKKYVVVRANGANTGIILIGTTASNVGDGFILSASQISPPIYVDQLNKVYLKGGAAGQGYSWIAC
jgi:hypothetical protein